MTYCTEHMKLCEDQLLAIQESIQAGHQSLHIYQVAKIQAAKQAKALGSLSQIQRQCHDFHQHIIILTSILNATILIRKERHPWLPSYIASIKTEFSHQDLRPCSTPTSRNSEGSEVKEKVRVSSMISSNIDLCLPV